MRSINEKIERFLNDFQKQIITCERNTYKIPAYDVLLSNSCEYYLDFVEGPEEEYIEMIKTFLNDFKEKEMELNDGNKYTLPSYEYLLHLSQYYDLKYPNTKLNDINELFDKNLYDIFGKAESMKVSDAHLDTEEKRNIPLIIKYNLVNEKDKIEYIDLNDDDVNEIEEIDNKIIVFKNNTGKQVSLNLCNCYNSTFEISNVDELSIFDSLNNNFIIGGNVRTIISNDVGEYRLKRYDDLLSNNFKFFTDELINIDHTS